PCVSIKMPVKRDRLADSARMSLNTRRTQSCGAWDMLRRKTFTPASMSLPIISAESVAGPSVETIFVCRKLPLCMNGRYWADFELKVFIGQVPESCLPERRYRAIIKP